jgi:hypothetical protein
MEFVDGMIGFGLNILIKMKLSERFPPLYSCSVCGKAVKVKPQGVGNEPLYEYHKDCSHRGVTIFANRKVVLRGKGKMSMMKETTYKVRLSVRQFLSWLTGRSV